MREILFTERSGLKTERLKLTNGSPGRLSISLADIKFRTPLTRSFNFARDISTVQEARESVKKKKKGRHREHRNTSARCLISCLLDRNVPNWNKLITSQGTLYPIGLCARVTRIESSICLFLVVVTLLVNCHRK